MLLGTPAVGPLFCCIAFHPMNMSKFIHSPADGHLGWFQFSVLFNIGTAPRHLLAHVTAEIHPGAQSGVPTLVHRAESPPWCTERSPRPGVSPRAGDPRWKSDFKQTSVAERRAQAVTGANSRAI